MIYFIMNSRTGYVKIGVSRDPYARLAQIQVGNADLLTVCRVVDVADDANCEAQLHLRFAKNQERGEWFRPTPELLHLLCAPDETLTRMVADNLMTPVDSPTVCPLTPRVLLGTDATALRMGVAKQTLAIWRLRGCGPPFIKMGSRVLYDPGVLDSFVEARTHSSTSSY